jgi:hydrogenase-4 component B
MNPVLHDTALILAPALPLGLAGLWAVPRLRGLVGRLAPWAPLPALFAALAVGPGHAAGLDWMLLGSALGLTETTRVFLLFTALLWLGAGIYARGYLRDDPARERFDLFWLLTLAGNLGLVLALDVVSFYGNFALMPFAAYGLVVHTGTPEARRAGRVYLAMAIPAEGLLLTGLMLAAGHGGAPFTPMLADLPQAVAASAQRDLIVALLWLGFGVKAGLPLLHLWLPLAHPVAPVPASAVLSGAMIKGGLLGWLHTLPLGLVALPGWGTLMLAAGFLAAFGAAFLGLHQQKPKTVLAYSSISQMGLITVGVGAGTLEPRLWPLLAPALAVFALHHALAKGALFLGVGIARLPCRLPCALRWALLALPALALTGALGSGVRAKLDVKTALAAETLPAWWSALPLLLQLAAVGTTLILARYLWLLGREDRGDTGPSSMWWGWGLVLAAGLAAPFLLRHWGLIEAGPIGAADWLGLLAPVLAGTALALLGLRFLKPWPIPPGDALALLARPLRLLARFGAGVQAGTLAARNRLRPSAVLLRRLRDEFLHPDRLWQREAALVYALLLALLLLTTLLPP